MQSSIFEDTAKGIILGTIVFIFIFSAFPIQVSHAAAGTGKPYFTIVLEAPNTNPSRRQWAAIIQNSWSQNGIGASLIYVASFTILSNTVLGPNAYKLYSAGGFDAFFVGAGGGTALPDFGAQNVVYYKGETSADFPPVGSNWYWWKNSTYNTLADQYAGDFNAADRIKLAQKMVQIVAQERPGLTILYPAAVYAYSPKLNGWNTGTVQSALTATTAERDFVHWNPGTGATQINMAETGDIDNINVLRNAAQNTLYSQNVVVNLEEPSQEPDGRAVAGYACDGVLPCTGTAKWITSSSDHLTWTENIRPHVYSDGVAVTADDYVYSQQSSTDLNVGFVGLSTVQSQIGLFSQFTYLNGTTSYIKNGTYVGHTAPSGWTASSAWKSLNTTAFQWTMPTPFVFTNPIVSGIVPIPKHIYEQFPTTSWATGPLSGFTNNGALSTNTVTYTWNKAVYGGNGSYKAYGPVTDGAYIYHGYDPVSQTATIVKNPLYWNITAGQEVGGGLSAINEFTATTIHFIHIVEKTAAIAGLGSGTYNVLDSQYTFNKDDEASITHAGGYPALVSDPSNGWQDLVLNDNSPVWGDGTQTPLGQQNPAMAHKAALLVRHALSDLIPRQQIVTQLLQGIAAPAITSFYYAYTGTGIYHDMYAGLTADPYDPAAASSLLQQAGYNTGSAPGIVINGNPTVSATCKVNATQPISVPDVVLGNSLTFQGVFAVKVGAMSGTGGGAVVLEQSTNGGANWTAVAFTQSNEASYYTLNYQPTITGTVQFRTFWTGIPWTYIQSSSIASAGRVEAFVPPQTATNGIKNKNITDTQYGLVQTYKIGTLSDVVGSIAQSVNQATANGLCNLNHSLSGSTTSALQTLQANIQTALNNGLTGLQNSVTTQQAGITSLNNTVSTVADVAYAALAVAIILGLAAILLARRKPS